MALILGRIFLRTTSVTTVPRRHLRGDGTGGGRWRNRRPSHYSNRILLDKFIKMTKYDCSLLGKAPFDLKVRGSYFDAENNVDRDKNRRVGQMVRNKDLTAEDTKENGSRPTSPIPPTTSSSNAGPMKLTDDIIEELEEAILATTLSSPGLPSKQTGDSKDRNPLFVVPEDGGSDEEKKKRQLELIDNMDLTSDFAEKLDSDKREMFKKSWQADYNAQGEDDDDASLDEELEAVEDMATSVPLHVLFYGKNHNRLDSYSIMNSKGQQQSHVYVTDASSAEEVGSMFGSTSGQELSSPVGSFSIWVPRPEGGSSVESPQPPKDANKELPDDLASGFKLWVPGHILEQEDHMLKAAFLVPTMMNKIFLEGEKHANLELDASLVEDLETVGLVTDCGTVKVKDLTSYQIRLASAANDITCQGILDGNIMAELGNDGNFFAHSLEGPSATVTTESGDIVVWSQCYSERSHFFTRSGNVSVRNLNNQSYISIKEAGDLEASLSYGSVSAVVRTGDIVMEIGHLSDHSTLHVTEGNIVVTVPARPCFRINATAPATSVAPTLLNTGDMVVSDDYETFTTTGLDSDGEDGKAANKVVSFHDKFPTLNMITNKGKITIKVRAEEGNSSESSLQEEEDSSAT